MNRKLVIDAQLFQTPAWYRGMGKYSLELLRAISEQQGGTWSEVEVILSNRLEIDKELIPEIKSKVKNAEVTLARLLPNEIGNQKIVEHNRGVIDGLIEKDSDKQVDFLILSLMQGEIFPAFPSAENINKLLLFYDLIPLMFHDAYLKSPNTKREYLTKIGELLKADHYFAISKTVANDLALYIGIDADRITNIDGGPIDHSDNLEPLDIKEPFILMPTGNDLRKNNRRGIAGFEEFNKLQSSKYTLVVTSFFKKHEILEFSKLSSHVHFTGNIPGSQLRYLYKHATALLFPAEYEGLGLPILEAIEDGKPIACSNISALQEMSDSAFYYFEPDSIQGIERALTDACATKTIDKKEYKKVLERYSWARTAEIFKNTVLTLHGKREANSKPSIKVLGINPSNDNSGGRLLQEAHAEISRFFNADYYLTESSANRRENYLQYITQTGLIKDFPVVAQEASANVYFLSNNEESAEVLLCALAVPGIVVLFDTNLEKVWKTLLEKGFVSQERYDLEREIDNEIGQSQTSFLASLLAIQKVIVVFKEEDMKLAGTLSTHFSSKPTMLLAKTPYARLVYPEARVQKTIKEGKVSGSLVATANRSLRNKTDYDYDQAISRMKRVFFDDDASEYELLNTSRFDTIPNVGGKDITYHLSPDTHSYKTFAAFLKQIVGTK